MKLKLTLSQIRLFFLFVSFWLTGAGAGYWVGFNHVHFSLNSGERVVIQRENPPGKENIDFSLFWTVWDRLAERYIDKTALVPSEMVYGAIRGMVASLKDPYTVFLSPKENQQSKEDLGGAFEGIGIQLGFLKDHLAVIAPIKGMPAEEAGIRAGDYILKIDGKEATDISLPDAVSLIRGPKGTKVRLTLLRQGESEPYEVEVPRREIVVPTVEVEFLENYAHIKLTRFGERTNEEWDRAVDQILNRQPAVAGIILDLRDNPGGYMLGAVYIASEFLDSGIVLRQEGAEGKKENFSVNRQGRLLKTPLVVIINKGTASASEILAGCLQEHKRTVIVGEVSFGKGTIQEAEDLPGGAGLHITDGRWLLPSGKSIDKNGIKPDNEFQDNPATKDKDEQLEKAIELLKKNK